MAQGKHKQWHGVEVKEIETAYQCFILSYEIDCSENKDLLHKHCR